jgi:hypothetical protein
MTGPLCSYRHPFDVARHPTLEPEVKRAILASWASDAAAVPSQPALRKPPGVDRPVPIDDVFDALRLVDRQQPHAGS